MKKNWQALMVVAALSIIFGSASLALAQEGAIAGGYSETSSAEPEVIAAARFAVRARARRTGSGVTLLSIERAEVQVVAGLNYRLNLRVKVNHQAENVTTVVYKNLRQKYSLSSWKVESNPAGSGSVSPVRTIKQLENSLAVAFMEKTLSGLDAIRPFLGKVRIVIEHSLAGDNDSARFEIKDFKSLRQAEQWLKSRERDDGTPVREARPLLRCKGGLCLYNFEGGILHNHLYLQKFSYGLSRGRPYIKTIYLLDGD